jgi:hypothetical protein
MDALQNPTEQLAALINYARVLGNSCMPILYKGYCTTFLAYLCTSMLMKRS